MNLKLVFVRMVIDLHFKTYRYFTFKFINLKIYMPTSVEHFISYLLTVKIFENSLYFLNRSNDYLNPIFNLNELDVAELNVCLKDAIQSRLFGRNLLCFAVAVEA